MNLDRCRFVTLVWKILEHKAFYYHPELVNVDWHSKLNISDDDYDQLKQEYYQLAGELNLSPTLNNFPQFDLRSNISRIILMKLSKPIFIHKKLLTNSPIHV